MLNVDSTKMLIEMTRGDTAHLVFSAVDSDGNEYEPSEGDVLTFSVATKAGTDPVLTISNTMDDDAETFWAVDISADDTADLSFTDYVFDVQLTHSGEVDTIIGATDSITPTFRVWQEVTIETE